MGWYHDPAVLAAMQAEKDGQETAAPAASTTTTTSTELPGGGYAACPLPSAGAPPPPPPAVDSIYHLAQKSKYQLAVAKKEPYFPPTFVKDGKFTRASVDLNDIIEVANDFYSETKGEFIVIELNCKLLYNLGIPILSADAPTASGEKSAVKCLQIYGGISTTLPDLITAIHGVERADGPNRGKFIKLLPSNMNCASAGGSCSSKKNQQNLCCAPDGTCNKAAVKKDSCCSNGTCSSSKSTKNKIPEQAPPPQEKKKGWFGRKK